jgi:transposase InsO family protein
VEQRLEFVVQAELEEETFSELCRRFGISRQTGYKWWNRYAESGVDGLADESRAPHCPSQSIPEKIQARVVKLREEHPTWGPRKLRASLGQREPDVHWPAASSIGDLLKREGFVHARKRRRRTPLYSQPLAHADAPNRVWTADYKGWFLCRNGQRCDPLTIVDACSRYLLLCRAVEKTDSQHTRALFEAVFRAYGMPEAIRSDNGAPFGSPAPGGLSRLSVWWIKLGLRHERIDPGCPQQNGRHERMHETLKQETAKPPQSNIPKQQRAFEQFEQCYNWERPHEALQYATPGAVYQPSQREFPSRLPQLEYPDEDLIRSVSPGGYFSWKHQPVFVSEVLGGERIGLRETDDGVHEVYFGPVLLGWFDAIDRSFVADSGPRRRKRKK